MSYTPDLVATVIRSLNRKNAVAKAVDPANVRLVSVAHRDEKTLDVTLAGLRGIRITVKLRPKSRSKILLIISLRLSWMPFPLVRPSTNCCHI